MNKYVASIWRKIVVLCPIPIKSFVKILILNLFKIAPHRWLFHILPSSFITPLIRKIPGIADIFPTGKEICCCHYLGNMRVYIDTFYPIEKAMLTGSYEPLTLSIIDRFVQAGHICFDIGANVGAITFALAQKSGKSGKIYAFEPGQMTFSRLLRNLESNPEMKMIIAPYQLGVADVEGNRYWQGDDRCPGNAGLLWGTPEHGDRVTVTTIDAFMASHAIPRLYFMKIDVEGMEYEVIKGSIHTIERHRPILYYETLKSFETERQMSLFLPIETILKSFGYRLFRVAATGEISETSYPDLSDYTLALPEQLM